MGNEDLTDGNCTLVYWPCPAANIRSIGLGSGALPERVVRVAQMRSWSELDVFGTDESIGDRDVHCMSD